MPDELPYAPFCECGFCHGPAYDLPIDAWQVAGNGDLKRLAVLRGHESVYNDAEHVLEFHDGWVAVAPAEVE